MTQKTTTLTAAETVGIVEQEILYLDPDVEALLADVDDILRAVQALIRRPPALLLTGFGFAQPRHSVGSGSEHVRTRHGPARPIRAVQRGPPKGILAEDFPNTASKSSE